MDERSHRFNGQVVLQQMLGSFLSLWYFCCPLSSIAIADQSSAGVQASALQESYQTDLFTGRATFNIPILVPPGRQQMQPEVHLVYHNGGGNGWCGVGWELDLGGIQRDTRRGAPTYTSADIFTATIHGSVDPLVAIGNNEYRAKVDDAFQKYVFNGTTWEMWEKDGTHYFFGTTAASRVENGKGVLRWALDKVVNTHGDTVTITYTQDQGHLYPAQIQYTGNDITGAPPTNTVDFFLETRPDPVISYRSGVKTVVGFRLKQVVVKANGLLVHRYALTYTQSEDVTARSLFSGVTLYGEDNATALPPVTMAYAQQRTVTLGSPSTWATFSKPSGNSNGEPFVAWAPVTLDANGDSATDAGMYSVFGRFQGFYDTDISVGLSATSAFQSPPLEVGIGTNDNITGFFLSGDFNGDGLADVVEQWASNGHWLVALAYFYYTSSGEPRFGYTNPETWISGFGQASEGWNVFAGDFNGDGATDLAQVRTGSGTWTVQVALSNGSVSHITSGNKGFLSPTNWLTNATGAGEWLTGDFNGDGLTDLCLADSGAGRWRVFVSDGTQFLDEGVWLNGWGTGLKLLAGDANGDGFTDVLTYESSSGQWSLALSDGAKFIPVGVWATGLGQGAGWTPLLGDFNGDGILDGAVCKSETGEWVVATSNALPFIPLVQVSNGRGGNTAITYRIYNESPPFHYYSSLGEEVMVSPPFPLLVVDTTTVSDGIGHSWATNYTYSESSYSATAREWRGFGRVGITDAEGRRTAHVFNQDAWFKGRLISKEVWGSMDTTLATVSLKEEFFWKILSPSPYPGVTFPQLYKTQQILKDSDGDKRIRETQLWYDAYGNLKTRWDRGSPGRTPGSDTYGLWDDTLTYFSYAYNTDAWILDKPYIVHTYDVALQSGQYVPKNRLAQTDFYYDSSEVWKTPPTKGDLTRAIRWLNTLPAGQLNPTTRYEYDTLGNQTLAKEYRGDGTWSIVTTEYDPDLHIFPVTVTNPVGHVQRSTYDPNTGNVLTSTDPNGATTTYRYDPLGRLIAVMGPLDTSSKPGTAVTYDASTVPNKVTTTVRILPNGDTVQQSLSLTDGLGRVVEVKTEANDPTQQVVGEAVTYNSRGEIVEQYLPFYAPKSNGYVAPDPTRPRRTLTYDALGHTVRVTEPDGRFSTSEYKVSNAVTPAGGHLAIIQTNAKGQKRVSLMDALDRLLQGKEYSNITQINPIYLDFYYDRSLEGDTVFQANYRYDPLGRLIKVVDAKMSPFFQGNITQLTYDSLGRKLTMDDPDMGHWEYTYDFLGNLTQQKDAKGQTLSFTYDILNRQTAKSGPGISATYRYDTGANGIGRLSKVTDNSGSTEFFYDILGREIKTIKAVDGTSYAIERAYDALGRLTNLTYPDGEVVGSTYGPQGMKKAASSQTVYVQSITYAASGQRESVRYGNGLTTNYTYDSNTRWLRDLNTGSGRIQDFSYQYDAVGNISTITDRVHTAGQTFLYDDLNRLKKATGSYGIQTFSYDAIGNLTEKNGVTYTYGATPAGPHAVTSGSNGFSAGYDANGNMISRTDNGVGTTYEYDTENHLAKVITARTIHTTASIVLQPGWNFVGLPVAPDSTAIKDVMGSLSFGTDYDQVSRFNPSTQTFEHFVNDPAYNRFDTMELGKGYLIYVTNPSGATLTVSGQTPSSSNAVPITSNWNLIGSPTLDPEPIQQVLNNLALDTHYSQLSKYNSATQTYQDFTSRQADFNTMDKGRGYWLYGLKTATWTLKPNTFVTTFAYDGDGRRVKKTDRFGSTVYIGDFYEVRGSKTRKAIYVGSERIAEKSSTGELTFLHHDHLGSANVVTDAAGQVVQNLEYTPFGEIAVRSGPDTTARRFTGKEFDDTTGLYYYGARYYDPILGRFITADPTVQAPGDPQTLNRYAYARNNPIRFTDPTGYGIFDKIGKFFKQTFNNLIQPLFTNPFEYMALHAPQIISLAFNAMIPSPAFANFAVQVGFSAARGSAIGAITSWAFGGDVGKGAKVGAIGGAAIGALRSQQFQRFLQGGSSGTPAIQSAQADTDSLTVRPFARGVSWTGDVAYHKGWALGNGSPLWDMGSRGGLFGQIDMNVYQNIGVGIREGAKATFNATRAAFRAGELVYGPARTVSVQSLVETWDNFQARFIDTGQRYFAGFENSNFAANWVGSRSGAGVANVAGVWAPPGFSSPDDW